MTNKGFSLLSITILISLCCAALSVIIIVHTHEKEGALRYRQKEQAKLAVYAGERRLGYILGQNTNWATMEGQTYSSTRIQQQYTLTLTDSGKHYVRFESTGNFEAINYHKETQINRTLTHSFYLSTYPISRVLIPEEPSPYTQVTARIYNTNETESITITHAWASWHPKTTARITQIVDISTQSILFSGSAVLGESIELSPKNLLPGQESTLTLSFNSPLANTSLLSIYILCLDNSIKQFSFSTENLNDY